MTPVTWLSLLLFSVAIFLPHADAVICFIRTGTTSPGNGTAVSCNGYSYCYSYSQSSTTYYAGCSTASNVCSGYLSCVTCTTDYCNSLTPSVISCFGRSTNLPGYYSSSNGTNVTCATGVSGCFSITSSDTSYMANGLSGCGTCTSLSCVNCNTSYCNTVTPSAISCYSRSTSLATFTNNGLIDSCYTGFSTCYSYTEGYYTYAGCGRCSTENYASCVTCSTDGCNTHLPNSISCYARSWSYVYTGSSPDNGTIEPCSTGVSTCYSYAKPDPYWAGYWRLYSGCGVCNSNASSYGCTTCNTNNCNYVTTNFTGASTVATSVLGTQAPSAAANTSSSQSTTPASNSSGTATAAATSKNVRTGSISCYYSFAENQFSSRRQVSCYSGSCFQYSFSFGFVNYFFAGCGNCTSYSSYECRTCMTDLCNSGTPVMAGPSAANLFALIAFLVQRSMR